MTQSEIILILGMVALSIWVKGQWRIAFYPITALVILSVSSQYMATNTLLTLAMWALSTFLLIEMIISIFDETTPARGLSVFRALWQRTKRNG